MGYRIQQLYCLGGSAGRLRIAISGYSFDAVSLFRRNSRSIS